MARPKTLKTLRPLPPEKLGQFNDSGSIINFAPSPEVWEWVRTEIIDATGKLYNPDHAHLETADLEVMWAAGGFIKAGRSIIGTAEQVTFRMGGWQKARAIEQMHHWFGRVPEFLITLDASYCRQCTDVAFCALIEHELYHVAHELDGFGQPKFSKDGQPKLVIRGHDAEEFVGVVRRYGVGDPEGGTARLVAAAKQKPEVSGLDVARACGTCMLRAA